MATDDHVTTSVALYPQDVARMKEMNIPISATVRELIHLSLQSDEDFHYGVRLGFIGLRLEASRSTLAKLDGEIRALESKRATLLMECTTYSDLYDETVAEFERAKLSAKLSRYIRELNNLIIAYHYDPDPALYADVLHEIGEMSPQFDLHAHITRLRSL